jgi:hypothetical protein
MATIGDTLTASGTIVIQTAVSTNEFVVREVHESIQNRFVRAEIELGPFTTETRGDGSTETRGSSRRGVTVWENEAYDAIRDTWVNADLIAAVTALLG